MKRIQSWFALKKLLPLVLIASVIIQTALSPLIVQAASVYDDWLRVTPVEPFVRGGGPLYSDLNLGFSNDLVLGAIVLTGGAYDSCSTGATGSLYWTNSCSGHAEVKAAFEQIAGDDYPDESYIEFTNTWGSGGGSYLSRWNAIYSPDPLKVIIDGTQMSIATTVSSQQVYGIFFQNYNGSRIYVGFNDLGSFPANSVIDYLGNSSQYTTPDECYGDYACLTVRYIRGEVNFDIAGYEGITTGLTQQTTIYPSCNIDIQYVAQTDSHNVTLTLTPDYQTAYRLPNPDYAILTLTDNADNIIIPDSDKGWISRYSGLEYGVFKAHCTVFYLSEEINEAYLFGDTWFPFETNGTNYVIRYDSVNNVWCSVRDAYQVNCTISQPDDDVKETVTGDPQEHEWSECSFTEIWGCVENIFYWLGSYFGISGDVSSNSPFFQFDTNQFGLTAIVTAPIGILNSLQNAEYTCTPLELPLPNTSSSIELPCMNSFYTTYLGALYVMWQTIITGVIAYYVIVKLLHDVKSFKDPQDDKIEVLKL